MKYRSRRRKTGTLGVLTPQAVFEQDGNDSIYHAFYARILHALGVSATELGYHLLLEAWSDSTALPLCVRDRKVDGVIVRGWSREPRAAAILKRMPVVQLQTFEDGVPAPSIMPDNRGGILQAMRALRERGHSRIGFFSFGDPLRLGLFFAERYRAYQEGMVALDLSRDAGLSMFTEQSPASSGDYDLFADMVVAHFMALPERPTAVLAPSDAIMLPFIRRAQAHGWRVPDELSAVGYDNVSACGHSTPPLASLDQPIEAMATAAVNELVRRIEDPRQPVRHIRFDVQLIRRASLAPPGGRRADEGAEGVCQECMKNENGGEG